MEKKIILTISVLTSKKEDQVRRCLESLKEIRDAVSSELIIVDTSEDVHMHAVVSEYADEIVEYHWNNDFSAARNAGLSRAKGEWFLYLDDDEWFTNAAPIIDFFKEGTYKNYDGAMYIQRNFIDFEGRNKNDMWVSRMARIRPGMRFVSLIHEYIKPVPERSIGLNALVDHYGYAGLTEEDQLSRYERNHPLLLAMIEKEPDEPRWRTHAMMDLWNVGKTEELEEFAGECLSFYEGTINPQATNAIASFYAAQFLVYVDWMRDDLAKEICHKALADPRLSLLGKAYFMNRLAQYKLEEGDLDGAIQGAEFYLKYRDYFKEGGQDQMFQSSVAFIMNTYDEQYVMLAYQVLICAGLGKGDTSYLEKYFACLDIGGDPVYIYPGLVPALLDAMVEVEDDRLYINVLCGFHSNEEIWQRMELMLLEYVIEHKGAYEKFEPLLKSCGADISFLRLYTLRKRLSEPEGGLVGEKLCKALKQYTDFGIEYYGAALKNTEEKNYPADYRGMLVLKDILAESEVRKKLPMIKEAVKAYPPFAEVMKRYAYYMGEKESEETREEEPAAADPQMEQMVRQIVPNVRLMLDGGMVEEAAPVIDQLKSMLPGHPEVIELERKLQSMGGQCG